MRAATSAGHVRGSARKAEAGGGDGLAGHIAGDEAVVTEWVFRCSLKWPRWWKLF